MGSQKHTLLASKNSESCLPSDNNSRNSNSSSFLVDLVDINASKQNLQDLLVSFRGGKLKAFGDCNAIDQMENIRHMQGQLARRHFELDAKVNYKDLEDSQIDRKRHDSNMTTLLGDLKELGTAIKNLNVHSNTKKT